MALNKIYSQGIRQQAIPAHPSIHIPTLRKQHANAAKYQRVKAQLKEQKQNQQFFDGTSTVEITVQ